MRAVGISRIIQALVGALEVRRKSIVRGSGRYLGNYGVVLVVLWRLRIETPKRTPDAPNSRRPRRVID